MCDLHVEVLESVVTRNVVEGIALKGEVTGIDVHSSESETSAFFTKIKLDTSMQLSATVKCVDECTSVPV